MQKVLIFILGAAILAAVLVSCLEHEIRNITPDINTPTAGGWSVESVVAGTLPNRAQIAFHEVAKEIEDVSYTPLACLYERAADGHFWILVQSRLTLPGAKARLKILELYKPTNGKAELVASADFDLTQFLQDAGAQDGIIQIASEPEMDIPSDGGLSVLPFHMEPIARHSFGQRDSILIEPLACIGSQVVAGTNYAFVCRETSAAGKGLCVKIICVALDGSVNDVHSYPLYFAHSCGRDSTF